MIVLSVVRELGSDAAGAPGLGSQKVAEELSGASLTQDQRTGFQNGSTWLVSWFPATWPPCGVTQCYRSAGTQRERVSFHRNAGRLLRGGSHGEGFPEARRHSYQEDMILSLVDFRDCAGCCD